MSAPVAADEQGNGAGFNRRLANGPVLLVAATVVFGLVLRFPEWKLDPPEINDALLHQAMARYAAVHWHEHWPARVSVSDLPPLQSSRSRFTLPQSY